MQAKDPDEVIKLNDNIINEFGGIKGLIGKENLISALSRPFVGLAKNGTEFYPSLINKAAALIHSLIKNHPFIDGNKRTAAQITHIYP